MRKALIFGYGITGRSVLHYLNNQGFEGIVVDKHAPDITTPFYLEDDASVLPLLDEVEFLVKSPGISWNHPLIKCAQGKTLITSEIELGFQALLAKKDKKIVWGITGSNGKTTTTLLITHVLNTLGKRALACGNIGVPLLSCLDADVDILVLELSSYQIEDLKTKGLNAAVILNITPNHLDRYASFDDYALSKLHIQNILKEGEKLFLSDEVARSFSSHIRHFFPFPNLNFPSADSENISDNMNRFKCKTITNFEETIATIFPLRYRDGRFSHDFENVHAAFALCQEIGIEEKSFWEAVSSFKKPPHRLEFVRRVKGVSYINDSKSSSVDAVIKGVSSVEGDVLLIAGGVDKGGSYGQWNVLFKNKVKKVLLIGRAQHKIYDEIHEVLDAEKVDLLSEALKRAALLAQEGDSVLFSPGCASFDQFKNFEHRGEIFKNLVEGL